MFSWLGSACPCWWGKIFLSLLVQMPISLKHTLTDIPINNAWPFVCATLNLVTLTSTINHHNPPILLLKQDIDVVKGLSWVFEGWLLSWACGEHVLPLRKDIWLVVLEHWTYLYSLFLQYFFFSEGEW
jgi:hypothetical protein